MRSHKVLKLGSGDLISDPGDDKTDFVNKILGLYSTVDDVVLNMKEVDLIDSAGIAAIVRIFYGVCEYDGEKRLVLTDLKEKQKALMKLLGIDKMTSIFPTQRCYEDSSYN